MNKKFIRCLSVLAALVLCLGLVACKKDNATDKQANNGGIPSIGEAINEAGEYYEYRASYEKLPVEIEKGYMHSAKIINNKLYAVAEMYDEESGAVGDSELVIYDFDSKENKFLPLSREDDSRDGFISSVFFNEDGTFQIVYTVYDNLSETSFEPEYLVYKFDAEGKGTLLYSLTDILEGEENSYLSSNYFTKEGNFVFCAETKVYEVGPDGVLLGKVDVPSWVNNMFVDENSDVFVSYYSPDGPDQILKKVDFASRKLADAFEGVEVVGKMTLMPDGKYLVTNETGAYSFDPQTKENLKLWAWLDLDMQGYGDAEVVCTGNDSFKMVNESYDDGRQNYELVTIEKVLVTKENARKEIVIGCLKTDWALENVVIDFNKTSTDYRVKMKPYYEEGSDYEAAEERFTSDLTSNPKFDMVILDSFRFEQYAKKGAFVDIGKFMENDADIKRSDFYENALDAFTVDGKDYAVIPSVEIYTMFGSKAVFKDKTSWTPAEMLELRKQYPDIYFLDYPIREEALMVALFASMDDFIDVETGKCDFNNQTFYDILEFAKTFGKDIDYENYNSWENMRNGSTIVSQSSLSDMSSYDSYKQLFPEGATIIGMPTNKGNGNTFIAEQMFSILESSDLKEECWDFLKKLLNNKDYERMSYMGFPTLKANFEDYVKEKTKTDTYIDENGVEQIASIGGMGMDNEFIEIYPPTKEDMEVVRKIYESASSAIHYDEQIFEIISEEAEPYFEGQKSASDVANIIQSRLSIYIAENN